MADLADMLSELLSDPQTGEKLRALLDDRKTADSAAEKRDPDAGGTKTDAKISDGARREPTDKIDSSDISGLLQSLAGSSSGAGIADILKSVAGDNTGKILPDGIDAAMMMKLTRAMAAMNSSQSDNRTRLLYDLKPYISKERARRVDEAAQMLRMLNVIDIFRDGENGFN